MRAQSPVCRNLRRPAPTRGRVSPAPQRRGSFVTTSLAFTRERQQSRFFARSPPSGGTARTSSPPVRTQDGDVCSVNTVLFGCRSRARKVAPPRSPGGRWRNEENVPICTRRPCRPALSVALRRAKVGKVSDGLQRFAFTLR